VPEGAGRRVLQAGPGSARLAGDPRRPLDLRRGVAQGEAAGAGPRSGAGLGADPHRQGRPGMGAESPSGVDLPGVDDAWEQHAGWWQEGFTDGADPEYEEQILPLAAEGLRDTERVLDVGTGEGQVARWAVKGGAGLVVGVDPTGG